MVNELGSQAEFNLVRKVRELEAIVRQLTMNPAIDNARRGPLLATPLSHTHDHTHDIDDITGDILHDPTTETFIEETFPGSSITSGQIGTHGWVLSGTIGAWALPANLDRDYPSGPVYISAASALSGIALGQLGATGWTIFKQEKDWDATFIFALADNTASVNTQWSIGVGFADAFGFTPSNAIWLEKQPADASAFFAVRNAGVATRTAVSTGVIPTDLPTVSTGFVYYRIRLRKTAAGEVRLNINGGADIIVTATLPASTTNLAPIFSIGDSGVVARLLKPEFMRLEHSGLVR